MKKFIALSACALVCSAAFAWGPRGHSTVASLADLNLKPSTKKQVEAYLGRSIGFYSSWADEFREQAEYAFSSSCHTFPVGADFKYAPVEGKMDAIKLITSAIEVVKDRKNQTDSAVVVNLKFIIHMVGDMHCPVHSKYTTINTNFKVYPYKKTDPLVKYHTVWDQEIINRRCEDFSPAETATDFNRLSKKQIKEIQDGTLVDWANQCAEDCRVIYDDVKEGDVVFKPFYNKNWPLVQQQITLAGYRLAKVLNDCFAK